MEDVDAEGLDTRFSKAGRVNPSTSRRNIAYRLKAMTTFTIVRKRQTSGLRALFVSFSTRARSYVVQTSPRESVQRCILMTTDPGDLVLDPTCGSGTTAYISPNSGGAGG